jgi:hypothetical protein
MRDTLITAVLLLLVLAGCVPAPSSNSILLPEELSSKEQAVVLAPLDTPDWIPNGETVQRKFESAIVNKLKGAKFNVLPSEVFDRMRKETAEKMGGIYDRVTGKRDQKKYDAVWEHTLRELHRKFGEVLVLHPSLVIVLARFSNGRASWDGTYQRLETYGFRGTIKALSLCVVIENTNRIALYSARGGIELSEKISYSGESTSVPRDRLLAREELYTKAVYIALGPLVGDSGQR